VCVCVCVCVCSCLCSIVRVLVESRVDRSRGALLNAIVTPRARYLSVTALYAARSMARYVAVWLVGLGSPVLQLGQCHCGLCENVCPILSMSVCIDWSLVTHSASCDL